jgi:hypothetical protein
VKKKTGGISSLAPKRSAEKTPKPSTALASETPRIPLKATLPGVRGGEAIQKRLDRAISLTVKVSRSQYRHMNDARFDVHPHTTQQLVLDALAYYFEHRHGTKF